MLEIVRVCSNAACCCECACACSATISPALPAPEAGWPLDLMPSFIVLWTLWIVDLVAAHTS
eukprot:3478373-Amphidinium_carterae.1